MLFSIKTVVNLTAFVLAVFLVVLIFPLFFIGFIPFFIYRQVVIQLAKVWRKELAKIVTSRSSILISEGIYHHPKNTLISVLLVEGIINLAELRTTFQERVVHLVDKNGELRYPELKQNIEFWMGFPFWRNLEKFDLQELIHSYKNEDCQEINISTAENLMRRLTFEPFSKDKPLWEIIVLADCKPDPKKSIGVLEDKKYSAVVIRTHHGLGDAFSQLKFVETLSPTGNFSFIKATDYTQQANVRDKPMSVKILKNISIAVRIPFELARMVTRKIFILSPWTELQQRNTKLAQKLSKQGKGGVVDKAKENYENFHCSASPSFYLSDIKDIKVAHGVSGTAVLYGAVVGALRNTVFAGLSRIPSNVLLCHPLPLPGANGKLRNHITVGSMSVPMAEMDVVKRLHKIHERLEYLKTSTIPISFALWMKTGGSFPSFMSRIGKKVMMGNNAILISNVAGPQSETDFAGYPIKDFLVSSGACAGSKAISVSLLSTGGRIRVSIGADNQIVHSDEQAKQFTEQFFKELDVLRKMGSNFDDV